MLLDLVLRRAQTFNPFFLRMCRVKESKIVRNAFIVGLPPVRRVNLRLPAMLNAEAKLADCQGA
jgi:hypothetical protein